MQELDDVRNMDKQKAIFKENADTRKKKLQEIEVKRHTMLKRVDDLISPSHRMKPTKTISGLKQKKEEEISDFDKKVI
jgi:hypothetical protein